MSRTSPAQADAYPQLHRGFAWQVPARFNIANVCCRRWAGDAAHARRVAVRWEREGGEHGVLRYGELGAEADRLAHALLELGVRPGDRVV